jgi:hypothetical protein
MLILVLPLSAFAESFTVTTNKEIYTADEKAIIVGVIPDDAPDGYSVLIKVTGPGGGCATQNLLPSADNSFRSRSIRLDECGLGEFTASAFYAELKTTSTFTVSESSQEDGASKLELRMLKTIVLQAQDTVNTRVKELVEGGYVLPEEVVQEYNQGVSEASLALQAIEFGDAAEAKQHKIFAIKYLQDILDALSDENVARFEQTASNSNSDIVGAYSVLQRQYSELQDLAEKNRVDKEDKFQTAALLLSNIERMISKDNYESAERNLERVNAILEEIRSDLYDRDGEEKSASYANTTSAENEKDARKLTEKADMYEKQALELLNQTGSNTEAQAKLQEALSHIASARANIEVQDFDSARDDLRVVLHAINATKDLIEHEDDKEDNTSSSSSGKNSGNDSNKSYNDHSEDSRNSGNGSGNEGGDQGNNGSDKGNSDEDDQ